MRSRVGNFGGKQLILGIFILIHYCMCYGFRLEVLSGSQLTVLLKLRSQKFFYISDQCFDVIYQVSYNEAMNIQLYLEFHLKPTWDWLITVMDSTEAQLRFGSALSETTDPNHPSHPLHR